MIQRNSTIKNFWMIFFGVVALLAIAAAVTIGVVTSNRLAEVKLSTVTDENTYKVAQENNYRRALYAACDSMKNLDANLGKAAISNSAANQTQMLTNVVIHANQVNQNLANLPIADSDNLSACQKFVNQAQDYATYLLKKLANGKELSASERTALSNLDNVATNLYDFLEEYANGDSGMFITNGNGAGNFGALTDSLDQVDQNSFQYEKLIYDGPFSDSVEEKTFRTDKTVTTEEGSKIVEKLFGKNTFKSKIDNKGIWYSYQLEQGRVLLAADGRVAEFETYRETDGESKPLKKEDCISSAEKFCKKLGYDVKGVWVSKTQDQTTYVNCATVQDGVIVYPDLIKVAVDSYSGEVVGLEAKSYLINHTDWKVDFGSVSQENAQKAVDAGLRVTNVSKALIEKDGERYLAYEFQCEMGSRQYYVYVDSKTGNEVEIFKVIQNTEGYTVM
ncbi:MAG: germination protein YpeB [Corallococcus sp.]|nr:germination protein YpeB [Corallococcus sp.]MCM1359311.1 germination protein YpeB [Corallococcus sp.]MCM1394878.1 germination protein YpeB [Corallococcus sp.]